MARFHVTARSGPRSERLQVDTLERALEVFDDWTAAIIDEGPLETVGFIRDYGPGKRVKGRVQIAEGRIFGGKTAGVDIMGDLTCVPFAGSMRRRLLHGSGGETPAELVRMAMTGELRY